MVKGKVAGVVEVGARGARRFSLEDESLLILMADRAGLALEHARAYEREVSNVEMLQRSLLPDRLPAVPGIELAGRFLPNQAGAQVGGDWYDAIQVPDGRLGLVIGDVTGHDIAAAGAMGQVRNALRAWALDGLSPAVVLARINAEADVFLNPLPPDDGSTTT